VFYESICCFFCSFFLSEEFHVRQSLVRVLFFSLMATSVVRFISSVLAVTWDRVPFYGSFYDSS